MKTTRCGYSEIYSKNMIYSGNFLETEKHPGKDVTRISFGKSL
jgi:hypothetical protein